MEKPSRQNPISLRLEPELTQWVKTRARENDRSINAELNRLIRQAKEAEQKAEIQ